MSPSPGSYNPNYNSIFIKAPAVHLPKIDLKKDTTFEIQSQNKLSDKSIDKKKKVATTISSPRVRAMNFNSYSPRRNIFDKKETFPIISYLKLYDYAKDPRGVNFSKLRDRDNQPKVDNIPAVCYYNPKYDLVSNNYVRDIKLSPSKNKSKRFRLQKLWRSYEVGPEYKIVNFKK